MNIYKTKNVLYKNNWNWSTVQVNVEPTPISFIKSENDDN